MQNIAIEQCSMKKHTGTFGMPKKSMIDAYGNWLSSHRWTHFCTFTTRYKLSVNAARKSMERLHSFLTKQWGLKIKLFWVAEPFDTQYSYHLHALIEIAGKALSQFSYYIKKAWQIVSRGKGGKEYNFTVIKRYKPKLGANFYVSKYLQRQNADYDFIFD